MIGQLRGKLIEKQPPYLMIDVNGVGYVLQSPFSTFFHLPALGQEVTLRTHFVVREDAQLLFGFLTLEEKRLFQEIIKLNGIGPKIALALLSGFSVQEFIAVIESQSVDRLKGIPGVGAKTAQRILMEMHTRLPKLAFPVGIVSLKDPIQEAIAALMALGYKAQEASSAINKVKEPGLGCEHIIKEALQGLAKV